MNADRPLEPPILATAGASHTGRVRTHNEDAFVARAPIFAVADGMGGHARGEAAAAAAIDELEALAAAPFVAVCDLENAVRRAALAIDALAGDGAPPGTTVSGVAVSLHEGRPSWLVFNVGDSRVYLQRGGQLMQISVDHSVRQELLDRGVPESEITVGRNVITRSLGGGQTGAPSIDEWILLLVPGDRMLVCSDGLSNELDASAIESVLGSAPQPADAVARLVELAVSAGGHDNVTAVVVDAQPWA